MLRESSGLRGGAIIKKSNCPEDWGNDQHALGYPVNTALYFFVNLYVFKYGTHGNVVNTRHTFKGI